VQLNGKLRLRGRTGNNEGQRGVQVSQPLELDGTIFVPETLTTILMQDINSYLEVHHCLQNNILPF
jgi:hypothetical protein